jgi:siderophore synthetase component
VNPDTLTAQALLNCLVREVSTPEEQVRAAGGHLLVRLARSDRLLRVTTRRPSAGLSPRLTGEAALRSGSSWQPAGWADLAALIAEELTLATGKANDEFAAQVRSSHAALSAIMRARSGKRAGPDRIRASGVVDGTAGGVVDGVVDGTAGDPVPAPADQRLRGYLRSEQALIAGHRFHPAPKARGGDPRDWLPFAPEAGASFPLRFLAVRADALDTDGDTASLDRLGSPAAPPGYHVLPAHPWQLRMLGRRAWLRRALGDGTLVDLGPGHRRVVPTSSVRTVYDPATDVFCKFSLNVRITNCVRKNSWYELAGAVALTRLLRPVFADLATRFPGTALLGEPGYRTMSLGAGDAAECLAVIVREGLRGFLAPGVTPVLAAALAEPREAGAGQEAMGWLLEDRDPGWLLAWWEAYVRAVAPPVLYALFGHGVVLEPHLQNVLVGVDADGMPVQAIFRDLEGVKLVTPRHDALLATLKPGVARALAYGAERGWNRVAYCLLVNHLAEIAAAIADRHPGPEDKFEAGLWERAHVILTGFARDHAWPPQLRAVLAGAPLPAKANLRLRWARGADRESTYLNVRNPMRGGPAIPRHGMAPAC